MTDAQPLRAWVTLIAMSGIFFLITAVTFSSLGVVLPAMVKELSWSWSGAGLGFSLLGVFCGITAIVPAFLIRRIGVRATLVLGGAVMAAAFACLALTHGLGLYLIGCSLAGLGFTLLATVPGTYLVSRCFHRPDLAYGLYFTVGGLGGVAGPQLYFWVRAVSGGWRDFWIVSGAIVMVAAVIGAVLVDSTTDLSDSGNDTGITRESWSVGAALRTPQFAVLAAAYSVFLFVDITVNALSAAHLAGHGISLTAAGSLISLWSFINAGARLAGGLLSRFIAARKLLIFSLISLIIGLLALSAARGAPLTLVYAAGIGIGSGLTFFAATILLLDYFGRAPNLELFSIVNLVSTVGSIGPAFAGFIADRTGSFAPAFAILAVLVLAVLLAVLWMRAPSEAHPA